MVDTMVISVMIYGYYYLVTHGDVHYFYEYSV